MDRTGNDADSFHVRHNGKEYLFRLYFVDAPETSMQFPNRVREQADWFGTTDEMILHFGEAAKVYVDGLLKKPFTVYTQFVDARGASSMQRFFAMVKVHDRYLCELLVEQGFARIYGIRHELPEGTPSRRHIRGLEELESTAKWKKAGLWGGRKSALLNGVPVKATAGAKRTSKAASEPSVTLSRDVAFYTRGKLPTFRGMLKKGDLVTLTGDVDGEMVSVCAPFRGSMDNGQCRRYDLEQN